VIQADPDSFVSKVERQGGRAMVVKPGESYEM
jgi:hypothetical protein